MEKHARESYLTLMVSVVIPLAQATASGLIVGVAAGAVAKLANSSAPFAIGAFVAALITAVVWCSNLLWWRRMVTELDSIGEPVVFAEPLPSTMSSTPPSIRIELMSDGGNTAQFLELPVEPSKMYALCRGLMDGVSFTEAYWCGGSQSTFTRGEFVKLRDEMLRRGLLMLNSNNASARGYRLTNVGRAVVRYLATTTPPPSLESRIIDEHS